jgi:hypothetical protein
VLSADEKTSIQARARPHPTSPPGPDTPMRVEHEYGRAGSLVYLAAWDVHRAKLFGRCEPANGIRPFDALVSQVMSQSPYRAARRVFWIVDNGSSHRGTAAVTRLAKRWPNLVLVHLPVHASWLNQIEIVFSILQRKVLRPNTFESLFELEDSILAFQERYQLAAKAFDWKLHSSGPCPTAGAALIPREDLGLIRHRTCEQEDLAGALASNRATIRANHGFWTVRDRRMDTGTVHHCRASTHRPKATGGRCARGVALLDKLGESAQLPRHTRREVP